jgi:hypothetical protein
MKLLIMQSYPLFFYTYKYSSPNLDTKAHNRRSYITACVSQPLFSESRGS